MKRSLFILFVIVTIGFLLRFILLGVVPPSPNWDEVALGYNAYSIFETGRDEYGEYLPFVLRSFDDYKPPLYTYLVIPSYLLFGLTTFAVRFPSMLFGTIAIVATYFLILELFRGKEVKVYKRVIPNSVLALLSSFLLAISPWHIQFSRIAFESNVGVTFNILGVLFFLLGLRKHWYLLLSAFFFGINPSMYQSDKVFTPLLVLSLVLINFKALFSLPKKVLVSAICVGIIALFPMIHFHLTDPQALARAEGVSVFSDQTAFLKGTVTKLEVDRERGDVLGLILDNRRIEYAKAIVSGYIAHFDLNWLFIHGDLPRHHAPNMGLLYLFELPFLLVGIYTLIFSSFAKRTKLMIFAWFLLAPVPAMITSGVPHAVRTLNFLPMFQIFSGLGILVAFFYFESLKKTKAIYVTRIVVYSLVSISILFNVLFYLNQYFVQLNRETSKEWLYGYKDTVSFVSQVESEYTKIVVSNQPPLDQSYMFFLFYLKYPPAVYQKESIDASGGFRENHSFGKYEFRPITQDEVQSEKTLYIGRPSDFSDSVSALYEGNYLDGSPAIKVVPGSNL